MIRNYLPQKRTQSHVYNSAGDIDSGVVRGSAHLAVQQVLGILPQRRSGACSFDFGHTVSAPGRLIFVGRGAGM